MTPGIETAQGRFKLQRLPVSRGSESDPLRAWDAANEFILNHLAEQQPPAANDKPVLLINDAFGALAVSLNRLTLHGWSDSFVAHQATMNNFRLNQLQADYTPVSSLDAPPSSYDLVLLKIPKTLALLEFQLSRLKAHINEQNAIIAAGMVKHIHSSTQVH